MAYFGAYFLQMWGVGVVRLIFILTLSSAKVHGSATSNQNVLMHAIDENVYETRLRVAGSVGQNQFHIRRDGAVGNKADCSRGRKKAVS